MGRKGRSKKTSPMSYDDGRSNTKSQTPRIVEEIHESDDEEIPEDDAFNSEDERLFGHFFEKNGNEESSMASADDDGVTSESDTEEDEDNVEDESDGGQYMLDLLDRLDGPNTGAKIKMINHWCD